MIQRIDDINNARQYSIDILKYVAAFFIICIHADYNFKELILPFTRFGVPVFFMITGYFLFSPGISLARKRMQIIKIAKITLYANLLYFVFSFIVSIILFDFSIKEYFVGIFNKYIIIRLVFFNVSPFVDHLWYLFALLYGLIIFYCLEKHHLLKKYLYLVIPVFLIIDQVFGMYGPLLMHREIESFMVRNYLLMAIPYILLGKLIREQKDFVIKVFSNKRIAILMILLIALTAFENLLLSAYGVLAQRNQGIGATMLSVLIFILAVNNPIQNPGRVLSTLAQWGRRYTLQIYIIQMILIFPFVFWKEEFERSIPWLAELYQWCAPIIILSLATFYASILDKIKVLSYKKPSNQRTDKTRNES